MQVIDFDFLRKFDFLNLFHCFILPWIRPRFHDVSYVIHNSFFPKIEKATFTNQFNLLIF